MKLQTKILLDLYKQPIFPNWACAKQNDLFRPSNRTLCKDESVLWNMQKETGECADHIEMSGFYASAIISYGKNAKNILRICRHLVVPNQRIKPNVTQSSFSMNFHHSAANIKIDGKRQAEIPIQSKIKGNLKITSKMGQTTITREFYPAVHSPALIEKITIKNNEEKNCQLYIRENKMLKTFPRSVCAFHAIKAASALSFGNFYNEQNSCSAKTFALAPGESIVFYAVYYAISAEETFSMDISAEITARQDFIHEMFTSLRLETPSRELNAQFAHCVLRGSESIFETKNGLMHAPGGGNYYAALWTNDQCEYANPFFQFSGYTKGIEQSINCYHLYEKYMDKSALPMAEKRPLVTSITSCGDDYWNGAGDRGDCEMYAYGLARFLLSMGDKKLMADFFDNLVWCLDFALSRKTKEGVIASDADELENRFESGDANLFTSCLTYDALNNCAVLAEILGNDKQAALWKAESTALKNAIEQYFGDEVEGYQTYRYYAGNQDLRAWICMPLSVEIFDRSEDTVRALFGKELYENAMLKTTSKDSTTWDRSLLFALRGTLLAGKAGQGTKALLEYCNNRLLGCHAPYPFEAYPEGNRAHLAAESLLFARAVTEGLFGLRAIGYRKLRIAPQLSDALPTISLSGLSLFGLNFAIHCEKNKITVEINNEKYVISNNTAVFDFNKVQFV